MNSKEIWGLYCSRLEYNSTIKDIYDRPIMNYVRKGTMLEPSVSSYLIRNGFKPKYPNNKEFATCISHDIDQIFVKSSRKKLIKELVRGRIKNLKKEISRNFYRKIDQELDPLQVLHLDNKYNIKSTYYFLSIEKDNVEDYNYSLDEVKEFIYKVKSYGNEIGLHGSRKAYNDLDELKTEKEKLLSITNNITGYRNHVLKFEIPTTWNLLEREEFLYDTTFGAASCPGFRNGMCFPFQPFDINKNRWINVYELPLIVMDISFFSYLKLDYLMAFDLFKSLVKTVKDHNGVFTFLWHNNYMNGDMGRFYEKCIKHLTEQETWFSTSNDLVSWWIDNKYFDEQRELLNKLTS